MGVVRDSPGFVTCGGIFCGSMGNFIGGFSVFLYIQITLVAEFYRVIHVIEEAKKMCLSSLWLECDSTLVCVAFTSRTNVYYFIIGGTLALITMGKSGLGFLTFPVKAMHVLTSLLT